jgi:hypothetical protein
MSDFPPAVAVPRPIPCREDWHYVIDSLIGGLEYEGVVRWLAARPDLPTALHDAQKLRDGMVAT